MTRDVDFSLTKGLINEKVYVMENNKLKELGLNSGNSSILDGNNVEFKVPTVSPGTFVETLVLFPVKLVPEGGTIVDENALPKIMANEASLADEANKTREEARQH